MHGQCAVTIIRPASLIYVSGETSAVARCRYDPGKNEAIEHNPANCQILITQRNILLCGEGIDRTRIGSSIVTGVTQITASLLTAHTAHRCVTPILSYL